MLVPVATALSYDDYRATLTILNDKLDSLGFTADRAMQSGAQLVFLPNRGDFYQNAEIDGAIFDPLSAMASDRDEYFRRIEDAKRKTEARKQEALERRQALSYGAYDTPITAFNDTYSVDEVLQRAGYSSDNHGNWRHPASQSGSYSASVLDGRVYSLSPNDLLYTADASNDAHDAFSAFCTLLHGGDQSAAIKDACDNYLFIGGESWNTVSHRAYAGQTPALTVDSIKWDEPRAIADTMLPVESFDVEILPEAIRDWVCDTCERMQSPIEFAAVAAMVALSSVIGRKCSIQPKQRDDWQVIPNTWGLTVGAPSTMKSPTFSAMLSCINTLAAQAQKRYSALSSESEVQAELNRLKQKDAKAKAAKAVKEEKLSDAESLLEISGLERLAEPTLRRYVVNDATVEALAEVLIENPVGVLVYRDELSGLLRSLDKEGQEGARSFYLQAYNGDQGYTVDRIMRGKNRYIPAVCFSLLGGIQPSVLQSYVSDAVNGGRADDGLLQRFGLMVYPDASASFKHVDRAPDAAARERAYALFKRLDSLSAELNDSGSIEPIKYRFDSAAQVLFDAWYISHMSRLKREEMHPAIESHLMKFTKLVPAIALINALCNSESSVSAQSVRSALAWAQLLESHAQRIYQLGFSTNTRGAKAILAHLRDGSLNREFKASDIYRSGWTHLSSKMQAYEALDLLVDLNYVARIETPSGVKGGRPAVSYLVNPSV
jgi:putative DNA primase/helicase